jgi:hypothetical protein
MRKAELIAGIIVLVFGLVLIFWIIPDQSERVSDVSIQPAVYPLIAAWAMVGFSAVLIAGRLTLLTSQGESRPGPFDAAAWLHLVFMLAILLAALLAFAYLGFIVGGIALVAALMLYMGARNPVVLVGIAVGIPLVIWAFFELLLERSLP